VALQTSGSGGSRPNTDAGREAKLRAGTEVLEDFIVSHIRILRDGNACDGRLRAVDTLRFHGELFAKLSLAYGCAESASHSYEVHYSLFFDSLSRAEMRAQANVADYELAGETGRILFEPGNARLSVSAPPGNDQPSQGSSTAPVAKRSHTRPFLGARVGQVGAIGLITGLGLLWLLRRHHLSKAD
jgi:hypothetical protein